MTGDPAATDPTCDKSPYHAAFKNLALKEAYEPSPAFIYRRMGANVAAD
jgi:pyrroloquinoline quinone biosynthesis protein E